MSDPVVESAGAAPGGRARLAARLPAAGTATAETALDLFIEWVAETGLSPYPAQEEALLELFAGRHVVLCTPTGSGKSLVALGLHWKALCEGRRSLYTAPVKALVNEKFFALCDELGPERVGMLTGDASINPGAPVVCCTAEVLANMALRRGAALDAPYVVMDEFHYYGDPDRGAAWQIPLLVLRDTTFLLMSATLGDTRPIAARLRGQSGRPAACVESDERPVPLDYDYRETPINESVEALLAEGRAPVYIVHFTQRECAEQAQGLTSAKLSDREEKRHLAEALSGAAFDTPYGRELARFLRHGIGVHHAGLLPRYRLLVEQLAQRGLLKVICGTDTLGVGVNIPIRTVLFSRLSKFDGRRVALLRARDFHQIAGRAGRRGFDDRGSVVCQAPEHVIENRRRAAREAGGKKRQPRVKPRPGAVSWTRDTFERLVAAPPETLEPQLEVSHGMLVNLMQRPDAAAQPHGGYGELAALLARSHMDARGRSRQRRRAAALFRSLRAAGVVKRVYDVERGGYRLRVDPELQWDFSLHQALSLYVVEALEALDPGAPDYAPFVLTLTEAILDDPQPVLRAQVDVAKRALLARLKAEGVPYEERIAKLDLVTHPQPEADFLQQSFALFAQSHPWVGGVGVRPKSVAREMFESCYGFDDYVRLYGLQRSEGLLLRYLGQAYQTLSRSVPERAKTDAVHDAIAYLRALVGHVDESLFREWEERAHPERRLHPTQKELDAEPPPERDASLAPRAFAARVRAELHLIVQALAAGDYAEAARRAAPDPDDPWDAERFEAALSPFLAAYGRLVFDGRARLAERSLIRRRGPRAWDVTQVLLDPRDDNVWCLEGTIELEAERVPDGPLVRVRRIGV